MSGEERNAGAQQSGGSSEDPLVPPASYRASRHSESDTTPPNATRSTGEASRGSQAGSKSGSGSNKLLFLNYSNPSEFKSRSNKRIVKRWASTSGHRAGSTTNTADSTLQSPGSQPTSALESATPNAVNKQVPDSEYARSTSATAASSRALARPAPQYKALRGAESRPTPALTSSDTASSSEYAATGADDVVKKRKRRAPKRSVSRSSSSDDARPLRKLLPASLSELSTSPSLLIQTAFGDPFDVLPVKTDAHAHELIRLYLNAQLLSPAWTQVEEDKGSFQNTLASYRKSIWFPLVKDSTAALAALVAYIECTPGLTSKVQKLGFLEKYQGLALREANDELADPQKATSDSTLFAITLLMIAAQRTNDLTTFRIHARGISLILKQRREDRRRTKRNLSHLEYCFDASAAAIAARRRLGNRRDPYEPVDPLLRAEQNIDGPFDFYSLWRLGLISPHVCYFHAFTITLAALGMEAAGDHLAAASTVQHVFLEGVQPLPPMNPLESACLLAIRLVLHCLVRPVRPIDDKITLFCIFGIGHSIMEYGIEKLLTKAPQAVMWLTMVAGSQAKQYEGSPIKLSFNEALNSALTLSGIEDFDEALRYLDERFMWVPTMYKDALDLWTESLGLPAPVGEVDEPPAATDETYAEESAK